MTTETTNFVPDGEAPNGQFSWAAHPTVKIISTAVGPAALQTSINAFLDSLGLPLDKTRKYSVPRVTVTISGTTFYATLEYIEWQRT